MKFGVRCLKSERNTRRNVSDDRQREEFVSGVSSPNKIIIGKSVERQRGRERGAWPGGVSRTPKKIGKKIGGTLTVITIGFLTLTLTFFDDFFSVIESFGNGMLQGAHVVQHPSR